MTDKNYNELLRKRVLQENREFNEELEKLPAHEALSRAYEKVIKEDLVCSISEGNLTNTEARALLRLKHPLDDTTICSVQPSKTVRLRRCVK